MPQRSEVRCLFDWCRLVALIAVLALILTAPVSLKAAESAVYVEVSDSEAEDARVVERWKLYGSSHALVIGIDNYSNGWRRLSNAVKDAQEVARVLEERGFEVSLLTDLTGEELRIQMRRFFAINGRDPDARLFLWFAGHGHTENGEGYLVPADAPAPGSPEFLLSAYPMRDFGSLVRLANAKHAMAVFDSCFSGTVFTGQRSRPPAAITQATVRPVRLFLTSGDADQEVSDDGMFRSLFLSALSGDEDADANGDGYLTGSELSLYLENRLTNLSEGRQTPRSGKLRDRRFDQGDFVFLMPGFSRAPAPEMSQSQASVKRGNDDEKDTDAIELAFWQSIENSIDAADFNAYLQTFPNGKFRPLAEIRNRRLNSQQTAEVTERAEELFEKADGIYFGRGNPRDPKAAADSYRRAAERGHAGAQRMLGWLYQKGEGVEQDPAAAVKWYSSAAKAGDSDAQNNLGVMHAEGIGTDLDRGQAFAWFERAAIQGHAEAQVNLGDAYRDGLGVAKDRSRAFDWYRKAAASNHRVAQARIAGLYEQGLFDQPDLQEAVRWIRKAGVRSVQQSQIQQARPTPHIFLVNSEQEPNDIFGEANRVSPRTETKGAITPKGDADWYSFEVAHQGELVVLFATPPDQLDMTFRVWTSDKTVLTSVFHAARPGADAVGVIDLPASGRYLIEVRDGKNDTASPSPYSMQLAFSATADWAEPNDTFGSAVSIELNTAYQANILPKGEADWYCFIAPHQGELTASFTDTPAALDMVLRVWDDDKNVLSGWFAPLKRGRDTHAQFDLKSAGRYCLEVRDGSNDARSIDPYTLTPNFIASKDFLEPNDSFGSAAEIELNKAYQANILPKGEADWYCFIAPHQGELTASITDTPAALDMVLRVWDDEKNVLTGWYAPLNQGGETHAQFDLKSAGRHCLEVRDGSNDARSIEPYTLTPSFIASKDTLEPNDSFGTAAEIELNKTYQANILPKGEADWYCFVAKDQGKLEIVSAKPPKTLDISARLWGADKNVLSGWMGPLSVGGDLSVSVDLARPGRYCLEFRDGRNDSRAIEPYALQTRFTPTGDAFEPNDIFAAAKPVPTDAETTASLLPKGEVDWYALEAVRQGRLGVTFKNVPENLDLVVRLWNADKAVISGWIAPSGPGADTVAEFDLPSTGWFFLEVRDGKNDSSAAAPYTMVTSLQTAE